MPILEKLIEWSRELPAWQQDAIRRIFQGKIIENDVSEILQLLKHGHGLAPKCEITPKPLVEATPPSEESRKGLSLVKIHSIKDVNKIKDNESITFCPDGLTIIYGDNASGKSGYGRVLKRACRARHSGGRILGNLFSQDYDPASCAKASFDFRIKGEDQVTIDWDDNSGSIDELAHVAVFDKQCARVHVSEENEVDFLPYAADVLPDLAILCDKLKDVLKQEADNLPSLPQQLNSLLPDSRVGKFIFTLKDGASKEEFNKLSIISDEEESIFKRLKLAITEREARSPKNIAEKEKLISGRYASLKTKIDALNEIFSDAKLADLKSLRKKASEAYKAAKLASKEGFSKEPLPGVGSDTWRTMFDAAREYAEKEAYPGEEYADSFESLCVLCQQPLSEEASDRMERFEKFVKGRIEARAKELIRKVKAEYQDIEAATTELFKGLEEFELNVKKTDSELYEGITQFLKVALERKQVFLKGLKSGEWAGQPSIPDLSSLVTKLAGLRVKHLENAQAAIKTKLTEEQKAELKIYNELKERKIFATHRNDVIRYVLGLKAKKRIEACIKECDTTGITRTQTKLMKEAITDQLYDALKTELESLGVVSIKPKLRQIEKKGSISHKIVLEGMQAPEIDLSEVLSEGEDLVVAIASFLAELKLAPDFSVVVFDDPVSSLDHHWREKVAQRLVGLSKERQVIIFTHDIRFLFELEFQAKSQNIADNFVLRAMESRGGLAGVMLPDEKLPFDVLSVKKRIGRLNALEQEARALYKKEGGETEEYRDFVKTIYSKLRSAWERAVEELLFGDVVIRFRKGIETHRLKDVATDIKREDCILIEDGMTKCSTITESHDAPSDARSAMPNPDELLADIKILSEFREDIDSRRKAAKSKKSVVAN